MLMPLFSEIDQKAWRMGPHTTHVVRRISDMRGMYQDEQAQAALEREDPLVYEVFTAAIPQEEGHLMYGISIVNPGKVGDEFYMTKGHFHQKLETAEVYYCLQGHGYLVMQTPEGQVKTTALSPGLVAYVPPRWGHRSVNVGAERFVTFFIFPADAGHDYATIEAGGFAQLLLDGGGKPALAPNPRYRRAHGPR